VKTANYGQRDCDRSRGDGQALDDAPDPPECGRVFERITVNQREMRGPTDPQAPGIGVAEYGAALPGRRSDGDR
jgi:hypothetical protein